MPPDVPLSQSVLALQYRIKNLERDLKRAREDKQEAEADAAQALEQVDSLTKQNKNLARQLQGKRMQSLRTGSEDGAVLSTAKPAGINITETDSCLESTDTQQPYSYRNTGNWESALGRTDFGRPQISFEGTQTIGGYNDILGQDLMLGGLGPLPKIRSKPIVASPGHMEEEASGGLASFDIEHRDSNSSADFDSPNAIHRGNYQVRAPELEDERDQNPPSLEESESLIGEGDRTQAQLRAPQFGQSNAMEKEAPELELPSRRQLGTSTRAATERVLIEPQPTDKTSKPRITTSREVLARRSSEEEARIKASNEKTMQGPFGDMYYGQRPKIPDDFRLPTREESALIQADQFIRFKARQEQLLAERKEKEHKQSVAMSVNLDGNAAAFQNNSTGSSLQRTSTDTAREPEDSRPTDSKRKAEAACVDMADKSKKRRTDPGQPPM